MRWRSAALALLLAAGTAYAGDDDAPVSTAAIAPTGDLRGYLEAQLAAQADVLTRTRATVDDKARAAAATRGHRAGEAYRVLRDADALAWQTPEERMAAARRRAAARWLLDRDRKEQALLADESSALAAAAARNALDRAHAATAPLPAADLDRPVAHGTIARHFGTYLHERSKATLSRHGVDFDVADNADVHPVADGTVTYAGPIRGLDDGIIIDHGGWLSVYGKLDAVAVARGDRVVRGQVLAHAARRRVYLEVRVSVGPGGVPVDPEPLFK